MDTIYNIRDLPIGIYTTYNYEILTFLLKSIYLLHAKNEDDEIVKIWSNDFITDIINQHENNNGNFIISIKFFTAKISASYTTTNGEIVVKKKYLK